MPVTEESHLISFSLITVASLLPGILVRIGTLVICVFAIGSGLVRHYHPGAKLNTLLEFLDGLEETMHACIAKGLLPDPRGAIAIELSLER